MIICELRGIIFDIKAYPINSNVFTELQQIKKQRSVGLADIINGGDLQFDVTKLEPHFNLRGAKFHKDTDIILTGLDDDYYGEGYSFYRSKINKIKIKEHNFINIEQKEQFLLLSINHQFGLYHQFELNETIQSFNHKELSIESKTFLTKPVLKVGLDLFYKDIKLKRKNSVGFENKIKQTVIIEPKKTQFFNKTNYKKVVDSSLVRL